MPPSEPESSANGAFQPLAPLVHTLAIEQQWFENMRFRRNLTVGVIPSEALSFGVGEVVDVLLLWMFALLAEIQGEKSTTASMTCLLFRSLVASLFWFPPCLLHHFKI